MSVHRAIGGAVVTTYGTISLARSRRLAAFYAAEAGHCRRQGALAAARLCEARGAALRTAAGGLRDPDAADPGPP